MNQATWVPLLIFFVCLYCHLSAVVAVNRQCYDGYCFIKPDPLTIYSGDVQTNFSGAQQWCRNNNAVLLEIPDEHVQAAVQSYYHDNAFALSPFLNAQFLQTNWTWADGTRYNGSWGGAVQTGGNADARYAYLKFDQTTFSISSATVLDTTTRAVVCQYSGDQCPPGVTLTDGFCIVVNSSSSSWFGARLSCYQCGGNLASLHDIHSSSLVNKLQSGTEYWIGLTNGQWIWQDSGTQMVYNNWQPGRPGSSTCVCLYNGAGSWTDCDCGANTRPFICLQTAISTLKSSSNQPPSTLKFSNLTKSIFLNQTTSTMQFLDPSAQSAAHSSYSSLGLILGVSIGVGAPILIIVVVLLVVFRSKCGHETLLDDTTKSIKRGPTILYETTSIHPRSLDAHSDSTHRDSHAYQELHLANNNLSHQTPSVEENDNLYDTTLADPENGSQVPPPDPALDELQYQELRHNGADHIYTTPFRSIES